MIAEIFRSLSGSLARTIVDFYLTHQIVLNLIVACYGIILLLGHRNVKRIETALLSRYRSASLPGSDTRPDSTTWSTVLTQFATDFLEDRDTLDEVTREVKPRFIASPYFFSIYQGKPPQIIAVIGKKHAVPRSVLDQLINSTKEQERTQE